MIQAQREAEVQEIPSEQPLFVALLPGSSEFDEEALHAAASFPRVLRYDLPSTHDDESPKGKLWEEHSEGVTETGNTRNEILQRGGMSSTVQVLAVHRGYLISAREYRLLYDWLLNTHRIRLLAPPDAYEWCSYYPLQHALVKDFAPRAFWVPLPVPDGSGEREPDCVSTGIQEGDSGHSASSRTAAENLSEELVVRLCLLTCERIVRERGPGQYQPESQRRRSGVSVSESSFPLWRFVVLKDYVKSEKSTDSDVSRFLRAPSDSAQELAGRAAELALRRARKGCLFRGIVFKEGVPLQEYPASCREKGGTTRGGMAEYRPVLNEWRLWFASPKFSVCTLGGQKEKESPDSVPLEAEVLCAVPNSLQDPSQVDGVPSDVQLFCQRVAAATGNPYVTVDVAETLDEIVEASGEGGEIHSKCVDPARARDLVRDESAEVGGLETDSLRVTEGAESPQQQPEAVSRASCRWIVLEVGDGGASGPAPGQDMKAHWVQLYHVFGKHRNEENKD
uniref:ATP-grasp domain-containing protein n=1 Tax=Chromera velia CCMP2878 TaxID=1169474 RepID=A0A0G4HN42_9ALVE|eukprot:Cvel_1185.t1-p1 / transcript=Cvel_1185.t1 / gene=Cvel_1185 / organism=Chromera_velia_CCMP2878 / gene_product=hypothetical protein / transcript_product=hypothetical protein / location=Cvel_scaffold39:102959-104479(+) / protein_length=507 / sequence_SO=supercontig / SO=protein_coding / is_pseudo=false